MGICKPEKDERYNNINKGEIIKLNASSLSSNYSAINELNANCETSSISNVEFNNKKINKFHKINDALPIKPNKLAQKDSKIASRNFELDRIQNNKIKNYFKENKIILSKNSKLNNSANMNKITKLEEKNIEPEDDCNTILSNITQQFQKKTKKLEDKLILGIDDDKQIDDVQIYYLNEFNFNPKYKCSTELEFDEIIKSHICKDKISFTNLLLNLNERKWYNEMIELSENIKMFRNKSSNAPSSFNLLLNKFIKLYNHFDYIVWALGFYYYNTLYLQKGIAFKMENINLPPYYSLEWIKGFEWKGLHIRILTYDQAKKIIHEIKALKYIFFDFLKLFSNEKKSVGDKNLLSNEMIFPFMSYVYIGGFVLYVSVEIRKIFYDESYLSSNVKGEISKEKIKLSLIKKSQRMSIKLDQYESSYNNLEDFSYDEDILNEEINLLNYSRRDFNDSLILQNLGEKNFLKIFEDNNSTEKKYKYLVINVYTILPSLFKESEKDIYTKINQLNCIDIKNDFENPRFINLTKINNLDKDNQMNIISKLIRLKVNKNNIDIYQNQIEDIQFKIIYDNNNKANKINEQVTKYFVQFPLIQNYELSKLITTEYLNVGNLNIILNKYNTENTQEISDRNIIIFKAPFQAKKKYSIINKNNIFPKKTDDYITYIENLSKEMMKNTSQIKNIDNLKDFCDRFGLNIKFLPFCLEYIEDEYLNNLIQIYLYTKFIKKFFNYHEGQTLLMKLALYERSRDESILNSSMYTKENNMQETQKQLIANILKLILIPQEVLDNKNLEYFVKLFFENISFFIFLNKLKLKNWEKYLNFTSKLTQLEIKQILLEFNEICKNNPFLFIDSLEKVINFRINPFIKYRISIETNNLINLKKEDIIICSPISKSFIDISSIASYIFTNISSTYQPEKKMKMNPILSKIDLTNFFPFLVFKNPISDENKVELKNYHYYVNSNIIMNKFSKVLEETFNGIISHNGRKELILFKSYIYSMLNSIYNENNLTEANNILFKLEECIKYQKYYNYSQLTILFLFESILSDENIFFKQEYLLKSLLLVFLETGEIRGKSNKVHPILSFIIFQLAQLTENEEKYYQDYINEINYILHIKISEKIHEKNKSSNLKYYNFPTLFETKLETTDEYLNDINFKSFICNAIIDYFYSINSLEIDNDFLEYNNIKLTNNENYDIKIHNNRISNTLLIKYLMDDMSYKKYAPNNLILFFGNDDIYQTGQGTKKIDFSPKIEYKLLGKNVKSIFSGFNNNFVIDENDKIYTWGLNSDYQCGISTKKFITNPEEVKIAELEKGEIIKDITSGNNSTIFLSNINRIYLCGYNILSNEKFQEPKRIILSFDKENIIQVKLGEKFCLFLTGNGNVYIIKEGKNEKKGHKKVTNITNIKLISCGFEHCFAISKNNDIFCWGKNDKGQLGINQKNEPNVSVPKKLTINSQIDNIFCGKDFTIFHTDKKEIYACGNNNKGQLGFKTNKNNICLMPSYVEQFYNLDIVKISCGESHCIALIKDLTSKVINVWSWGNNDKGQLGMGDNSKIGKPKPIPGLLEYVNHIPKDISVGKNHTLILMERKDSLNKNNLNDIEEIISKYIKF